MINLKFIDSSEKYPIEPNKRFGKFNDALVSQVYYSVNLREKTKPGNSKGRSEMRGGGRKPWKQKGTGRARAGTIRSPLFVGGSVIFGPKNIKRNIKVPAKMKNLALGQTLVKKIIAGEIFAIKNLDAKTAKTKNAEKLISPLAAEIVFVINPTELKKVGGFRNISYLDLCYFEKINLNSLMSSKKYLFSPVALESLKKLIENKNG